MRIAAHDPYVTSAGLGVRFWMSQEISHADTKIAGRAMVAGDPRRLDLVLDLGQLGIQADDVRLVRPQRSLDVHALDLRQRLRHMVLDVGAAGAPDLRREVERLDLRRRQPVRRLWPEGRAVSELRVHPER